MISIIERQREYFNSDITKSYKFRINNLKKLYDVVNKYENDIAQALYTDLGKSISESYLTETGVIKKEISYYIKCLKGWMEPKGVSTSLAIFPSKATIYPEPLGVALIISPWNYPIQLTLAPLVAAIAAGCCCVVKPSEFSPACSDIIKKIISSVFSEEYISVSLGGVEVSSKLLDERFDHIFFTGSTRVGKIVMAAAAKNLTPVTLELGGKSPCIVDNTANIKIAAKRITWGKFLNAGQTCIAPDHVYVHSSLKDKLVEEIKITINKFYSENPLLNKDYPKIISDNHFDRLISLLKDGEIISGGKFDKSLNKIEPTIIENIKSGSNLDEEEIFGPILPIITYDNLDNIIGIIKKRPKPLSLYLFTSSKKNKDKVLKSISFGGGCVNDTLIHLIPDELPFGGVGNSGMGRYHGKAGFDTFSHYKSIVESSNCMDIPLKYPPYGNKLKYIKMILK